MTSITPGQAAADPYLPDPSAPAEDPFGLLADWLPDNADPARPLTTLATTGEDGVPNARTVVLTAWDDAGFWFNTDVTSLKAVELAANPAAAMVILFAEQARQLVVRGRVERQTDEEQALAYARRSRYLQVMAWLNTHEFAHRALPERVAAWQGFDREHETLEPSPTWVGYKIVPNELIFWQGRTDTSSIRVRYRRTATGWRNDVLAG